MDLKDSAVSWINTTHDIFYFIVFNTLQVHLEFVKLSEVSPIILEYEV